MIILDKFIFDSPLDNSLKFNFAIAKSPKTLMWDNITCSNSWEALIIIHNMCEIST